MAPNKAPGEDWLQTGFLKACGRPFRQAIASIAEDSFRLEHFPRSSGQHKWLSCGNQARHCNNNGKLEPGGLSHYLAALGGKGLQPWVIRWLRSYLEDRTARLVFDGETTERRPIRAGVPQGSPLSPILFILYISTLYDDLRRLKGTTVVGFADNTNILAFGRDTQGCCRQLEEAWRICDRWAATRGMQFEASKSELIHFTRAHAPWTETIHLGATNLEPTEDTRFLGVWLDRKLRYKAHLGRIQKKMAI